MDEIMDFDKYKNDVYYGSLTLWLAEQDRLIELFKQDLFKELNIQNHPSKDKFFKFAWKYGVKNGHQGVYDCAKDFLSAIGSDT
jgi:hypothetical protein